MKFARFPLSEAAGAILAHSMATPNGTIKKGRVLGTAELARLAAAGHETVVAAQLEPGDVGEDEAARRVAQAVAGGGTHAAAPFTGRANIFSDAPGIAVVDAAVVARINALDESLTLATVPAFERVDKGQMVGTVKIITFAVAERIVAEAENIAREARGLLRIAAFARKTAGLILTRMKATKPSVLEKRRQAISDRLASVGSNLGPVETVAHDEAAVAAAIDRMKAAGADPIIVFAASAIVDRGDIIPAALVRSGGEIIRLGMPVDPGNLMLLGRLGQADVIGAPSCAASPKINGFDWILERRLAGLDVRTQDVAAMGLGGLLKEIVTRPQPREDREQMQENGDGARHAPHIGAIVLAAGRSTRFGAENKLLADLDGEPVVRRTVRAVLQSSARPVLVVTGHQSDKVVAALQGLDVEIVYNPDFAAGLSTSLRTGLKMLPDGLDGVAICLADMPDMKGTDIDRLISGFAPKEGRSIIVPVREGKRGNPVVFATKFLAEIRAVEGDAGAKHVIGEHGDEVAEVDLGTDAIFADVDTPDALERLRARRR